MDNLHSQIEAVCHHSEIYSPLGLMRMLKKVHRSKPMKIIQMKSQDFKDFGSIAQGKYDRVPFTKVKSLLYKQVESKILGYKTKFSEELVTKNALEHKSTRSKVKNNVLYQVADHVIARAGEGLSQAKKADIRSVVDLGGVWGGVHTPQALVNRGAWGGVQKLRLS
jgi:hypothetical protein